MKVSKIPESPEHAEEAQALLGGPHIHDIFANLPAEVQIKLATGGHVAGLMGECSDEWRKRNKESKLPAPALKFINSVENALRLVAIQHLTKKGPQ